MTLRIVKAQKTAIIVGASGLVGGHCLTTLLNSDVYTKVVSLGRSPLDVEDEKLEHHIVDFENAQSYKDILIGDDLFYSLGTTMKKAGSKEMFEKVDFEFAASMADVAKENEIDQWILVSSLGASDDSMFFYNKVKGKLETQLKEKAFWALHIFRPSLLLGDRVENRTGEETAKTFGKFIDKISGNLFTKYRPVEAEEVGNAMVRVAINTMDSGLYEYASDEIPTAGE